MLLETSYAAFSLIMWTGIFLGILHTVMPCEDKAIFCFYAFGVARDWKQGFRIVNFYGLGLLVMNVLIGAIITYFGAIFGPFLRDRVNTYVWNGFASFSLIVSGLIMLIQVKRKKYWPHTDQFQELSESLSTLKARKRTAFLLGLLAGIPPCVFELAVYFHALSLSLTYGWGNGVWVVFFFGLGTWVGLYPLAVLGTMSGKLSQFLRGSTVKKIRARIHQFRQHKESEEDIAKENSLDEKNQTHTESRFEVFSGIFLILFGLIFLVLAIKQVPLFNINDAPSIPAPFNLFDQFEYTISQSIFLIAFLIIIFTFFWFSIRIRPLNSNLEENTEYQKFVRYAKLFDLIWLILAVSYLISPHSVEWYYSLEFLEHHEILGLSIIFVGILVNLISNYALNRYFVENEEHGFIDKGIFKRIRNPIALSVMIIGLGMFFLLPNILSLVLTIGGITVYNLKVNFREKLLGEEKSETWIQYKKQTGKYLPKLRKSAKPKKSS